MLMCRNLVQLDGAEVVEPPSVMTSFDCPMVDLGDA